ncbi:MAG TPA: DUF3017 domain-containing protein [Marmoricola sp.]|nr:DUF3017 domain-containing protein [Marmoricola sp.]
MTAERPKGVPSTIGGVVYLVVLAMAIAGLVLVTTSNWRVGVSVLGGGLLVGAVGRVALGEFESGMLRVRNKVFDVIALAGLGTLMIVLAIVIPNQPPL